MKTYPLLQSQLGVFYDCLKFPKVMQYNCPSITQLTDRVDLHRLEKAMQTIFSERQELKIRFLIDENGEPRQFIDETKKLNIVHREMTEDDFQHYAHHDFCRPFDIMGEEPLLRVELITTKPSTLNAQRSTLNHYMLLDIHHLVSDGTSYLELFPQRDLPLAYEGKPLPVQEYGI